MYFVTQRIRRLVKELQTLIYPQTVLIDDLMIKEGFYHTPQEAESSAEEYKPFGKIQLWGGDDVHAWFNASFTVPKELDGKRIVLKIDTGSSGWDATNPQFLVFINGEVVQGFDTNHKEVLLADCAKKGTVYKIDMQAYGGKSARGNIVRPCGCTLSVVELNQDIEKLYYDIKIPLDIAELLKKEDRQRLAIEKHLTEAVNMLDLRKPYSADFFTSIKAGLTYMEEEFYTNFCGDDSVIANCIGHTHIDVAWLWDLAQTRQKTQRSFSTVLNLMDEYPEYMFMSSQPQLYKYLKDERPEIYEKVKTEVKSGRWEAEGAMWVEADCNISSGESLVRQIIHGKRFFREEFGVENKILWLPDVFGYSDALPQILKKSGVDYFMTTKISWNEYNKMPYDTFKWVGLDGSDVLVHFITAMDYTRTERSYGTTYNGNITADQVKGSWERYQQKAINNEVLISFGYGDGGGGPTKEMLETQRRLSKGIPGCPMTKMQTSLEFFKNLEKRVEDNSKLPKWVGELYLEYHRGTLTSMARNKRYNRKSEFLYEDVELLASADNLINGSEYPKEAIRTGWEIICLNQFHDIIPGSSIKEVYDESKEQYEEIIEKGNDIKESALNAIISNITTEEDSVVVFNPSPFIRDEIIDIDYKGSRLQFEAKNIPAKGYKAFAIDEIERGKSCIKADNNLLENDCVRVELDKNANIVSIYDKKADREILRKGERANVLQAFEDKPHNYDAWDINIYYQEKMWGVDELISFDVVECSRLKASVKVVKRFLDSTITQTISIVKGSSKIDFKTEVDWKEKQILLKALFPVDIHAEKATYDIQFGNLERPTHWNTSWDMAKFEVCAHKWADLSEGDYGVSLLNDCKYGYDIKGSDMRITLIKSAVSPNENADREVHHFTYSLYPHKGDWKQADTVKLGYELNQPVSAVAVNAQDGSLPNELSFVNVDKDNVVIEVIKQAEESKDIIIRLHECKNKRTKVKLTFFKEIVEVYECDLEERQKLNSIKNSKNSFEFLIMPYELKTFRLKVK